MPYLLPAVRSASNRIHVGQKDENHEHIKTRHSLTARNDNQHGFVPSDNERMWLSRQNALKWLQRFEPDVYSKLHRKVPAEGLHSHIYAAAKGIVMKITADERKNGFNPQEGEQQDVTADTPLRDVTCVVIDHGISIHLAEKLVESYGKVYLYVPNSEAYPNTDRDQIGTGLKGVDRIYGSWYEDRPTLRQLMDMSPDPLKTLFFFPDVGFAGMQADLRKKGYKVCGSGDADKFELDKWFFQQEVEKLGLPTSKTVRLVGMKKLRGYLDNMPPGSCFIKVSFNRGLTETKKWLGSFLSSVYLDDLAVRLGRHAERQVFLVQHKIDSVGEIGTDTVSHLGEIPDNSLCGLEMKDAGYLGKVFEKQPDILQHVNDLIKPLLAKMGLAGHYSTEIRCIDKTYGAYIDPTIRMPSPPGEAFPDMYEKHCYAQALWDVANGRLPVLTPRKGADGKPLLYCAEIILTSSWLEEKHWLPIEFPESAARYIRLKNHCIIDGKYFIVPNGNGAFFGGAVGYGHTAEEACEMACKYAEMVQGEDVKYEGDVLTKAQEGIAKMAKIGITF